jgi:hypothetical protein
LVQAHYGFRVAPAEAFAGAGDTFAPFIEQHIVGHVGC